LQLKLIDGVIPEPPGGAQEDWDTAAKLLANTLRGALAELGKMSGPELVDHRYEKFRHMANFFEEA
jgi:acetyl-CoA carboxylase alpha subunit